MDPSETLVVHSENHSLIGEEAKKGNHGEHSINVHYFHFNDEYSDIYFDKSCINQDDVSLWNFSNFPKEIHLDQENISDEDIFLRPNTPDHNFHRPIALSNRKSFGNNHDSLDAEELSAAKCQKLDLQLKVSHEPATLGYSKDVDLDRQEQRFDSSNQLMQSLEEDVGSPVMGSFTKNEGKLVFKITRFNRVTQKEKLITKNRRIISKWPHTSLKYYAKGMCKKWYHNFGREKKAFIWGHTDKPLYAKGFWKQCYLSKYKQKTNVKSEYKTTDNIGRPTGHPLSVCSNTNGFESLRIEQDLYFGHQNSITHM